MKNFFNNPAYFTVIRPPRKIAAFIRKNYIADLLKNEETREYGKAIDEGLGRWEKAQYRKKGGAA